MRKVSICTLTDLNPGFGGPWRKLWIFFVNGTFIMHQKKSFGQKKFWISCTGSKVPFWQFFHSAKMALLNLCMKFCPKDFFWGTMKVPFTKNIHNLFQGPPNPGFRSVKVQNSWRLLLFLPCTWTTRKVLKNALILRFGKSVQYSSDPFWITISLPHLSDDFLIYQNGIEYKKNKITMVV